MGTPGSGFDMGDVNGGVIDAVETEDFGAVSDTSLETAASQGYRTGRLLGGRSFA